jgi:signal-transduction protein with cAMP-binding, CBS, and nucleotidyltransferase domain
MRVIEHIHRSGVAIAPDRTVTEAAQVMEQAGVGCLLVMEDDRLVGIVTDRDLVRRAMARRMPADSRVDAVMTSPVMCVDAGTDLEDVYETFRTNALRRLAVTKEGKFVGILALDDLLVNLSGHLSDLVRPVAAEVMFAHRDGQVPAPLPHGG